MSVLVDYRCGTCQARGERWASQPIPSTTSCARCGEPARRIFGGALLTGAARPAEPSRSDAHSCASTAGVPGGCVLIPTAARMLAARARGDNRAIEKEIAYQERAISEGTLSRQGPVTTTFAGGPLAGTTTTTTGAGAAKKAPDRKAV